MPKTPIIVTSFNRLSYLEQVISSLETRKFENIIILDNHSTFPPLIEYLESSPHTVVRLDRNYGHLALWDAGRLDKIINKGRYILTDSDVILDPACPEDICDALDELLNNDLSVAKVGPSLRIDDIPACYKHRDEVMRHESQFWGDHVMRPDGHFKAAIDTTFALYRPNLHPSEKRWWNAVRTAFPYQALHLPWYANSELPSDEDLFYRETLIPESSHWSKK